MKQIISHRLIDLDTSRPIWDSVFTVAPLVVIGTKEECGCGYDMAPKHMVTPLGLDNYIGFVCTPRHRTYHNIIDTGEFTVSFPKPDQVTMTSLAASPRCGKSLKNKPIVDSLQTVPSHKIDALFVKESYLFLDCILHSITEGFGEYSLIAGKIISAHVDEDSFRYSERDEQEMVTKAPMLAYLAHGRYSSISESIEFPYPAGFKR
jgi:flavin reductase (DIM6/NTAB) family NADH-FMN oxidoreductase RutF